MYKYNLHDIKAAAQGNWQAIHAALGIPAHLTDTRKHQPCPACGGKDRYRYTDFQGNGGFICNQCTPQGGGGFDLLMLVFGLNFNESVKEVAALLGMNSQTPTKHKPRIAAVEPQKQPETADKLAELKHRFQAARKIAENGAALSYLMGRGLPPCDLPAAAIRETTAEYWTKDQNGKPLNIGRFPCMVAAITLPNGELQGLHYTYLQKNGGGQWEKLKITHPQTSEPLPAKKMFSRFSGSLKGAAVHLAQADDKGRLLIAEGIETTLAAKAIFNLPAVAALSANGMRGFEIPPNATELYICADNDPNRAGFKAAHDLAIRAIKQGLTAHIWQPETLGTDALDDLNRRKKSSS